MRRLEVRHSTEGAFALPTQPSRVQTCPVIKNVEPKKSIIIYRKRG